MLGLWGLDITSRLAVQQNGPFIYFKFVVVPIFEVNSRTVLIFLPMLIFIFDFFFRLVRAVAYRWLIRWICGHMGWDNTRPLPACVYHKIRGAFPTAQVRGYQAAEQRD